MPNRSLVAARSRDLAIWLVSALPLLLMLASQGDRRILGGLAVLAVGGFLAYFFYNQRQAIEVVLQPGRVLLLRGGTRRPLYRALTGSDSKRRFTNLTGFLFVFADEAQGLLIDLAEREPSRWALKPLPPNAELRLTATRTGRIVSANVLIDGTDHRVDRVRGRLGPGPSD